MKYFVSKYENLSLWLILSFLSTLILYYSNTFIITDSIYYNSFSTSLSNERIEQFIINQKKYIWIGYFLVPIFIGVKILLIGFCLYVRLFVSDQIIKIKVLFRTLFIAEFVFITGGICRVIFLDFIYRPETIDDLQKFAPLSLYSLLNKNIVPSYFTYPLQLINIFEISYMLVLAYLLSKFSESNFKRSLGYVMSGYGVGLLLWCVIVVFLQLQLS